MPPKPQSLPSIKRAPIRTRLDLVPDYLHVGLHKTGTTFLQMNVFPLLEPEVRYLRKSEAMILDGDVVTNRPHIIESFADVGDAGGPFLMSQEALAGGLFAPDLTTVRQMAARNAALRVIVSLRSQKTIIPSMYFQAVKSGYAKSLAAFVDEVSASGKLDYAALIDEIAAIVGPDRVLVLLFEEFTADPGAAFGRLCRFVDVGKPAPAIMANREKGRASDDTVVAKRFCNRLHIARIFGAQVERLVHWSVSAALRIAVPQLRQHGARYRLSGRQVDALAAQFASGNAALLSKFGYEDFAAAYMVDAARTGGETDPTLRQSAGNLTGL